MGPDEMGRAAAKVESVEQVLSRLLDYAESLDPKFRGYGRRVFRSEDSEDYMSSSSALWGSSAPS